MPDDSGFDRTARGTVLIVEAEGVLRRLLELEVADVGFGAECASSVPSAIDLLTSRAFDVVLVDTRLAGPALGALLRAGRILCPAARWVVLVPFHDEPALAQALEVGPLACLRLPCTAVELRSVLRLSRTTTTPDRALR
jgi:DNA-binding NtrC family response regulator